MLSCPPTTYEKMSYVRAVLTRQTGLPRALVGITCDYLPLESDFDLARLPLMFNPDGEITNPPVRKMIREALISNVCELSIKRHIFLNLLADTSGYYFGAFEQLLLEISEADYLVNLDHVDLSQLELVRLKLNNMSLKFVNFSASFLHGVSFLNADLSGAQFIDSELRLVNMEHACLRDCVWTGATLVRVNLHGASDIDLAGAGIINGIFMEEHIVELPVRNTAYHLVTAEDENSFSSIALETDSRCCCTIL